MPGLEGRGAVLCVGGLAEGGERWHRCWWCNAAAPGAASNVELQLTGAVFRQWGERELFPGRLLTGVKGAIDDCYWCGDMEL